MKLFVFDIDQTIIDDTMDEFGEWVVYPEVIKALDALLAQGDIVCLASGRNYRGCKIFMDRLVPSKNVYCITANGAALLDRDGVLLFSRTLPYAAFEKMVLCYGGHENWSYLFYLKDGTPGYVGKANFAPLEAQSNKSPLLDYNDRNVDPQTPLQKAFINTGADNAYTLPIDSRMAAYQAYVTSSAFLEFVALGVSKANAIEELIRRLGISFNDVYAFGDGGNDIEMIARFHGTAMGNADPRVKQVAEFVTDTAKNLGVVSALRNHWKVII